MNGVSLRYVTPLDCQLLYDWVNDDAVRKQSLSDAYVKYETHLEWFEKKMQQASCQFLIVQVHNEPIGTIRIDVEEGKGTISYSISKANRGKGYGRQALMLAEEWIIKLNIVSVLLGTVKKENLPSIKAFQSCGYTGVLNGELWQFSKEVNGCIK